MKKKQQWQHVDIFLIHSYCYHYHAFGEMSLLQEATSQQGHQTREPNCIEEEEVVLQLTKVLILGYVTNKLWVVKNAGRA